MKRIKPNRQELRLILGLIFKVIIPFKWRMFKQQMKNKFIKKTVIIK